MVLSAKVSGIVVRITWVVNCGTSPRRSALPSVRRQGVVAKRRGSSRPPVTGHSNSLRAVIPAVDGCADAPLTVCSHRRPSRRSRSETPACARSRVTVSKYVDVTRVRRDGPRRSGASSGWRAMRAIASGATASFNSVSIGVAAVVARGAGMLKPSR